MYEELSLQGSKLHEHAETGSLISWKFMSCRMLSLV